MGTLSLETKPAFEVWIVDGSGYSIPLGMTPLVSVELAAGKHQVRLVNRREKLSRIVRIEIQPNALTERTIKLGKGQLHVEAQRGHQIFLGKRLLGVAPLGPVDVYEGSYQVRGVDP